jgi:hypothetical protein
MARPERGSAAQSMCGPRMFVTSPSSARTSSCHSLRFKSMYAVDMRRPSLRASISASLSGRPISGATAAGSMPRDVNWLWCLWLGKVAYFPRPGAMSGCSSAAQDGQYVRRSSGLPCGGEKLGHLSIRSRPRKSRIVTVPTPDSWQPLGAWRLLHRAIRQERPNSAAAAGSSREVHQDQRHDASVRFSVASCASNSSADTLHVIV